MQEIKNLRLFFLLPGVVQAAKFSLKQKMFSFNDESELMQLCDKLIGFSADFIFFELNKIRGSLVLVIIPFLLVFAIDLLQYPFCRSSIHL